ncbi:MAG: Na+/H+ antiporter NhaC family protein, partial [Gammaproteobacteria bacterium]|nr:Na+/H+ antiporter NhaC family protein [Gammaproteobacteria bacterium]
AIEIETPRVGLVSVPMEISITDVAAGASVTLTVNSDIYKAAADSDGMAVFADLSVDARGVVSISAMADGASATTGLRVLPGWVSIMPPIVAIAIALALRNVIPALLVGVWLGATALNAFSPVGVVTGLLDSFQVFVKGALANADHAAIILFSMMIGGMVGIITRNGGMASIVKMIVSRAKSAIGGQIAVWLMGLMIFFDDYSNTLVVGNTARPITDQLKISREKLAYIVDSTAAPVVCLALITTWIGYEVGLIGDALQGIPELANAQAYTIFLYSIPYSFYPILAVVFVLSVASTGLDLGPMYAAELRARQGQVSPTMSENLPAMQGEDLEPKPNIPLRAINAFVPLAVLISSLLVGLYVTGEGDTVTDIAGSADAYKAMMWASFAGVVTAAVMTVGQRLLSAHETVDAWYGGARAMLFAMIILVLAWSLSDVTSELNTAGYLVTILADTLPVALVPAAVFVLSAITAFTTGTSWGTMGILMPLVVPLTWAVMVTNDMTSAADMHLLYSAVACNLAGAVWGDHCSPISDTTVLSSMASGCDHIEHVRTQMPYAMLVGVVGLLVGTIPGGFGVSPWISIVIGIVVLVATLRFFGRDADKAAAG